MDRSAHNGRTIEQMVVDSSTAIDTAQRLNFQFVPDVLPVFGADLNDDDSIKTVAREIRAQAGLGDDDVVGNMPTLGIVDDDHARSLYKQIRRVDGTRVSQSWFLTRSQCGSVSVGQTVQ